jgi:hypothetical protein
MSGKTLIANDRSTNQPPFAGMIPLDCAPNILVQLGQLFAIKLIVNSSYLLIIIWQFGGDGIKWWRLSDISQCGIYRRKLEDKFTGIVEMKIVGEQEEEEAGDADEEEKDIFPPAQHSWRKNKEFVNYLYKNSMLGKWRKSKRAIPLSPLTILSAVGLIIISIIIDVKSVKLPAFLFDCFSAVKSSKILCEITN